MTSDQGVAGSSPARCASLSTVSLQALYTLFDDNQAVMEGRGDGFFVGQNTCSDHLTPNRCDHLTPRVRDHLSRLAPPPGCLLKKKKE